MEKKMTMLDEIRAECFMLCDGAQECNGKLFILGGGWDNIYGREFPLTHHQLAIAIRLSIPWNDANRPMPFKIDSLDEDGNTILPQPFEGQLNVGRPATAAPGERLPVLLAVTMVNLIFPRPGAYTFRLLINGQESARTTLLARKMGG